MSFYFKCETTDCDDFRWGSGCDKQCRCKNQDEVCLKDTGACPVSGCQAFVVGDGCDIGNLQNLSTYF